MGKTGELGVPRSTDRTPLHDERPTRLDGARPAQVFNVIQGASRKSVDSYAILRGPDDRLKRSHETYLVSITDDHLEDRLLHAVSVSFADFRNLT
jgi:hypothetical protein